MKFYEALRARAQQREQREQQKQNAQNEQWRERWDVPRLQHEAFLRHQLGKAKTEPIQMPQREAQLILEQRAQQQAMRLRGKKVKHHFFNHREKFCPACEHYYISGHPKPPRPHLTFKQKSEDFMAKIFGSWMFVSFIIIFMGFWIALNIYLYETRRWDPYPFILLNLILSCVAAVQTPIILMSQNREAERDRIKYEKDHYVNYKAEKLIEHVHSDMQQIKKVLR